jgi:hypothetical protein
LISAILGFLIVLSEIIGWSYCHYNSISEFLFVIFYFIVNLYPHFGQLQEQGFGTGTGFTTTGG